MSQCKAHLLYDLSVADPELFLAATAILRQKTSPIPDEAIQRMVEETIWGLSIEPSFGQAICTGHLHLMGVANEEKIKRYTALVRIAGESGPALGKIMATSLIPVLIHGDILFLNTFLETVALMQGKGMHVLKATLEGVDQIIGNGDIPTADAYLGILRDIFPLELTYAEGRHFSNLIPKAAATFAASGRGWQLTVLRRVLQTDVYLADFFLKGLGKGLYLLSRDALDSFVSQGLSRYPSAGKGEAFPPDETGLPEGEDSKRTRCQRFLSLESKLGLDAFLALQRTVPLSQVRRQLTHYVLARTGLNLSARSGKRLPKSSSAFDTAHISICSDGRIIYLPEEISHFNTKEENFTLYKCLVKFESAFYEFDTFLFDLEKVSERCGIVSYFGERGDPEEARSSDLERFYLFFSSPGFEALVDSGLSPAHRIALAADLFTLFEHGRIRLLISKFYPGIIRQCLLIFQEEARRIYRDDQTCSPLLPLYAAVALGTSLVDPDDAEGKRDSWIDDIAAYFKTRVEANGQVETCGEMVFTTFPEAEAFLLENANGETASFRYTPLKTPFGRGFRPDLYYKANESQEAFARRLRQQLKEKGIKIYASDLVKRMKSSGSPISLEDIQEIIISIDNPARMGNGDQTDDAASVRIDIPMGGLSAIDLSSLGISGLLPAKEVISFSDSPDRAFHYPEWDCNLSDYLNDHVHVTERELPGSEDTFYADIVKSHKGLVRKIHYAFELLKPQGLKVLRPWLEGDEFDYRALLDAAIDRKIGRMPSERLYIKRLKQERDVAVLLLVDISRSTANRVTGSDKTVLDVEKEAIVLFCEALGVVGDSFAIAGFSGKGRFGVDYFTIKGFDDMMSTEVKARINAISPQRSTRMGAAIRHACRCLEKITARTRLLMILGDGFPNDVHYQRAYAIEDTHRAILETRSKNIHTKAITVNIASDARLDRIYGYAHHHVLSDVRELPDKLLMVYRALTY